MCDTCWDWVFQVVTKTVCRLHQFPSQPVSASIATAKMHDGEQTEDQKNQN